MRNFVSNIVAGTWAFAMPVAAAAAPTVYTVNDLGTSVGTAGDAAGLSGASDISTVVGRGVGVLLGVLGIVFLVLTVYAGFLYLTAQGEETNVKKAKKLLSQAVIGLVLIVSAYAISSLVIQSLGTVGGA